MHYFETVNATAIKKQNLPWQKVKDISTTPETHPFCVIWLVTSRDSGLYGWDTVSRRFESKQAAVNSALERVIGHGFTKIEIKQWTAKGWKVIGSRKRGESEISFK